MSIKSGCESFAPSGHIAIAEIGIIKHNESAIAAMSTVIRFILLLPFSVALLNEMF